MKSAGKSILTINGGSSSIKFAIFAADRSLRQKLIGNIERIGMAESVFAVHASDPDECFSRPLAARDQKAAVAALMNWIEDHEKGGLVAVGHRVVHGGPKYHEPQRLTAKLVAELRRLTPFDPEHLPEEILLTEAFHRRFPHLPQVACFDTAFHHDLPRVARILAVPRRYEAKGLRRYGFHGLSYEFLMGELLRTEGAAVGRGKVILAHLGNGASLAAVHNGKSVDTSMAFTPAAGIPMSTRSGDIDPGVVGYLARTEHMTASRFSQMINFESGLLGVSGTSSDMRDLMRREAGDPRAAEAVALFCYQVRKWIGAFAAALGGLDTLIFSGGIGENAPVVRQRICAELRFLGIQIDPARNQANAPVISSNAAGIRVLVMRTNEELVMARSVRRILQLGGNKLKNRK